MNAPGSIVDTQLQQLLEVVEKHREEECSKLIEQARARSRKIVRAAFSDARRRLHQDIVNTREDTRKQLASAEAQYQTQLRLARQELDQKLLATAWLSLYEALIRLWQDPETRKGWIRDCIKQASHILIEQDWVIECPIDWSEDECIEIRKRLIEERGDQIIFQTKPSIYAGLRITAGNSCVDGTVEGLLRQRTRIEELLLAAINKHRSKKVT
jgi:F0F1-type ATP synthase membrane subunit b/b'